MDKTRSVFLIHGRNEGLRTAMIHFLQALDLRPLEWEQLRGLTGKTSPSTFEVVGAGLANCQCALVILSGDDIAGLHPKIGPDVQMPQPRQNVIFEAGCALATFGSEQTILVKIGNLRVLTDIDGLNYVDFSNAPGSRAALVERLRDAGCTIESVSGHLSSKTGGEFDEHVLSLTADAANPVLGPSGRGHFTEYIADSALSFTSSTIDLSRELRYDLRNIARVDLKHHYLGPECASHWMKLCQHPEYGYEELTSFIDRSALTIFRAIHSDRGASDLPVDLISLGPGDGRLDARLLFRLEATGVDIGYYYGIDISFDLLQIAVARIVKDQNLSRRFCIKMIHGDFTQIERLKWIYKFDRSIDIFLLTGLTLGNYNEAFLLGQIGRGMHSGDYLLLDARLHGLKSADQVHNIDEATRGALIQNYSHPPNSRFAFGPVEVTTTAKAESVSFGYDVNQSLTVVPLAVNVVTYCEGLDAKMLDNGDVVRQKRLDLAATTLYDYESLKGWLGARGFRVVWSNRNDVVGLFLLKRD